MVAYGANLVSCITTLSTGRSLAIVLGESVAESRNYFLAINNATLVATLIFGITVIKTGRIKTLHSLEIVVKAYVPVNSILGECMVAVFTCTDEFLIIATLNVAGGDNYVNIHIAVNVLLVTKSSLLFICRSLTYGTYVILIPTNLGTGRSLSLYHLAPSVAGSSDLSNLNLGFRANATNVKSMDCAVYLTGRINGINNLTLAPSVAESRKLNVCIVFLASCAGLVCIPTDLGAGCILCLVLNNVVAESGNYEVLNSVLIYHLAKLAEVSGGVATILKAGSINVLDNTGTLGLKMIVCGSKINLTVGIATGSTLLVSGVTGKTGRCKRGNVLPLVTGGGNNILVNILFNTSCAVLTCGKSGLGAGSCNGIKLHDVLTGFKFIGEVVKNYEAVGNADGFVLGFEESYGYLLGTYARDKDAVEGSMMILEMTAYYKKLDMTLSDALEALYEKYGVYGERVIDIYMEGLDGIEKRRRIMQSLRDNAPVSIGGYRVAKVGDYKKGTVRDIA
ncbi:MAG: hypothetical protein IKU99_00725, partial [Clostridia bacterium]|nr:hypothetical protein [Clostridia bacterium]